MTPRARSASVSSNRRFRAPRSLKLPVTFMLSSLRNSALPASRDNVSEYGAGVMRMLAAQRWRAARTSSSVIMGAYRSVQTFDLYALRYHLVARRPLAFPQGRAANLVRGRLGMALCRNHP